MPRILFVGSEGRGSWKMRGQQMARALKARATQEPTADDWAWAQVVVLVKRAGVTVRVPRSIPVIWDALDFWAQPDDNGKPAIDLIEQAGWAAVNAGASMIICATEAMARDIGRIGTLYIPHHCRLGLVPTPIRRAAKVVAYDGNTRYLGAWQRALEAACARLGVAFEINPKDLSQVDALVAFRDGRWDGWACRQWKSGVKYVNAIAAGRPILTQPCAAFDEIQPVGATISSRDEVERALAVILDEETRAKAYARGCASASSYTVRAIAEHYRSAVALAMRRVAA